MIIKLGDNIIYSKSGKQRIVCRSLTEAELVALEDSIIDVLWIKEIVEFMSRDKIQSPIEIYQDNTSCMKISVSGSKTNKHIRKKIPLH